MAHIVAVLGEIQSVSAFASKTYPIHGAEDTLATAVKLRSGAVGVINFTFVSTFKTCPLNVSALHLTPSPIVRHQGWSCQF